MTIDRIKTAVAKLCPDLKAEVSARHGNDGDDEVFVIHANYTTAAYLRIDESLSNLPERLADALQDAINLNVNELANIARKMR